MIRKALVTTAAAVAIVATASPASARPVIEPDRDCSHGYVVYHGRCVEQLPHHGHPTTIGEWGLAALGVIGLLALA